MYTLKILNVEEHFTPWTPWTPDVRTPLVLQFYENEEIIHCCQKTPIYEGWTHTVVTCAFAYINKII